MHVVFDNAKLSFAIDPLGSLKTSSLFLSMKSPDPKIRFDSRYESNSHTNSLVWPRSKNEHNERERS